VKYYLEALRKYAVFSGRATRSEYWFFLLFNIIVAFVLGLIDGIINALLGGGSGNNLTASWLGGLYSLFVFVPGIAVSVRRLHDINLSGLWLLLAFVPIVGALTLLVMFCIDSQAEPNRFGPNPKENRAALAQP
jgi:uncharacterized membrane protein YhaH (DUF805 family)